MGYLYMRENYSFFDKLIMVLGGGVGVYASLFFLEKVIGIQLNTDIHAVSWWMLVLGFVMPILFVVLGMVGFRAIKVALCNRFFSKRSE
ncbi:hypothetical protein EUZ85_15760 [Hahella sp. KA22]|uniref:hypothetical protein n=1 Tax=Hahella sp. KA22 TaxID=1628392 RepID=UPI000FDF3DE3|nr:hypothetical protein [Hahella sp. KA22]AZZ92104.1 hypothetical protein ENC22_13195 [Hahella sp. KA22]QAY55474.1 hypothetical protein EUZ85_15760 [Hahella sp. KA22]